MLKILKKYDTKKYGEAKSQFNLDLSTSEKRAVLVLLHKMGIPIQIQASNKFDIKNIEFADIRLSWKIYFQLKIEKTTRIQLLVNLLMVEWSIRLTHLHRSFLCLIPHSM